LRACVWIIERRCVRWLKSGCIWRWIK
jgi:hypothetical protein